MDRERNLLFGVLAVQLRGVSPTQLVEAAALWLADSTLSLGDRLVQLHALSEKDRAFLDIIVDNTIRLHGNDPARAYRTVGGIGEWQKVVSAAPVSEQDTISTMLGLPLNVRDTGTGTISAVDEVPGRYSRTSEYARGGMGRILLVHDQYLDRDIALKELLPFESIDETASTQAPDTPVRASANIVGRFLREARVTGQLEHPSIVPVYELGRRPNGTLYYTMKLVRGQTLSRAIRDAGGLRGRLQLLPHVVDLCQAIAYAHSRRVVHRDIKPSNVMIGGFGETVVIDWGLAKVLGQQDPYVDELRKTWSALTGAEDSVTPETHAGAALGTPHYMSPEQATGRIEEIDARSDVYALGAVLYELLAGQAPFMGRSTHEILAQVAHDPPRPLSDLEPDVPQELAGICMKAMAKNPAARYQSAKELAAEIIRFQSGALVQSYRYSARQLLVHYYRRHRAIWNTAAAGLAALLLVVIVSYINILRARNREHEQRVLAERARDAEVVARRDEEEARNRAEHENYVAQIRLADAYMDDLKFDAARDILSRTLPRYRHWEWGYLMARANQDVATLRIHEDDVFSADYSPNGRWIVTAASDRTVGLWNGSTHELARRLQFADAHVRQAGFSPDSGLLAVSLTDGTVRIVDAATGDEVSRITAGPAPVNCASFSADSSRLVTAASDGMVKIWDWRPAALLQTFEGHQDEVKFAEFSGDGTRVVSWSQDEDIRLWDVAGGVQVAGFKGFRARLDETGRRFAYLDGGQAVVADANTGAELFRSPASGAMLNNARLIGSSWLVTASYDGSARVLRLNPGEAVATIHVGEPVKDALLRTDGAILTTAATRGRMDLWDVASQTRRLEFAGHGDLMTQAVFSPDGRRILTGSRDDTARVWDATQARMYDLVTKHDAAAHRLAISPDGKTLATGGMDDTVRIVDAGSYRERFRLACRAISYECAVAFSAEGTWLAAAIEETVPMVFDVSSGDLVSRYLGHDARVLDVAFHPQNPEVASTAMDGSVHLWNAQTGEERLRLVGHENLVTDCAFNAAGDRLATAGRDNTARVWNSATGAELVKLSHPKPVVCVAFSLDGAMIATGSEDRQIRLWAASSGVLRKTLEHRGSLVASVAFSVDGQRVLSASWDRTVGIWDAATGAPYLRTVPEPAMIDAFALGPLGNDYVLATRTGEVKHWHVVPWAMPEGADGADLEGIAAAYKQRRTDRLAGRYAGAEPVAVTVITTRALLTSSLQRLRDALAAAAPPFERGVVISDGPLADAVARLCLRPNDVLTTIDAATVADAADAAAAIEIALDSGAVPVVTVERDGQVLVYEFNLQEPIVSTDSLRLTREEARQLLGAAKAALEISIEPILQLNHEYAAALGEPQTARDDLAGLWLISFDSDAGRESYRNVNVQPGDRIVGINNEAIVNRQQLLARIDGALQHLQQATLPSMVDFDIERGSLKSIRRTVTVE